MITALIPTQRFGLYCEPWFGKVGLMSVPQWREGHAFARMRKRLIQQRFERVGCPAAINGLHRGFQGPIQAREVIVGDLLAEQCFDRGAAVRVAVMGPSDAFACARQTPTARLLGVPDYDKRVTASLSVSCSLKAFLRCNLLPFLS
jgi:hypothetical protein